MSALLSQSGYTTGRHLYATIWQDTSYAKFWDSTVAGWVTDTAGNRLTGGVVLPEVTSGNYSAYAPVNLPAGTFPAFNWDRAGSTPDVTDLSLAQYSIVSGGPAVAGTAAGVWVVPPADRGDLGTADTLAVRLNDTRFLAFDFGDMPELSDPSTTVATAAVTSTPDGLSVGAAVVLAGGYRVGVWVTPTIAGQYLVSCAAQLAGGVVISGSGSLTVA